MRNSHRPYFFKTSNTQATIDGYLGETLTVDESGLISLGIQNCPNLKEILLDGFSHNRLKPSFLTLLNTPKLRFIYSAQANDPLNVFYKRDKPAPHFKIEGRVASLDIDWGELVIQTDADKSRPTFWDGALLCHLRAIPSNLKNYIVILHNQKAAELTLKGRNFWYLSHFSNLVSCTLIDVPKATLTSMPWLGSVISQSPNLDLTIKDAPNLTLITGPGNSAAIRSNKTPINTKSFFFHLEGSWLSLKLHAPKLHTLKALNIDELTVFNAIEIGNAMLPIDCTINEWNSSLEQLQDDVILAKNRKRLSDEVLRFSHGETSALSHILETVPRFADKAHVQAGLSALLSLCELGVSADAIWQTRNELLYNNHKKYWIVALNPAEPIHSVWLIDTPLIEEAIYCDLMIWNYCQEHIPSLSKYKGFDQLAHVLPDAVGSFIKIIAQEEISNRLYKLILKILNSSIKYWIDDCSAHFIMNDTAQVEGLICALKNAKTEKDKKTLASIICSFFCAKNYEQQLPALLPLAPTAFRLKLIELSCASPEWINKFIECANYHQLSDTQARAIILKLAMHPNANHLTAENNQ